MSFVCPFLTPSPPSPPEESLLPCRTPPICVFGYLPCASPESSELGECAFFLFPSHPAIGIERSSIHCILPVWNHCSYSPLSACRFIFQRAFSCLALSPVRRPPFILSHRCDFFSVAFIPLDYSGADYCTRYVVFCARYVPSSTGANWRIFVNFLPIIFGFGWVERIRREIKCMANRVQSSRSSDSSLLKATEGNGSRAESKHTGARKVAGHK